MFCWQQRQEGGDVRLIRDGCSKLNTASEEFHESKGITPSWDIEPCDCPTICQVPVASNALPWDQGFRECGFARSTGR